MIWDPWPWLDLLDELECLLTSFEFHGGHVQHLGIRDSFTPQPSDSACLVSPLFHGSDQLTGLVCLELGEFLRLFCRWCINGRRWVVHFEGGNWQGVLDFGGISFNCKSGTQFYWIFLVNTQFSLTLVLLCLVTKVLVFGADWCFDVFLEFGFGFRQVTIYRCNVQSVVFKCAGGRPFF